MATELLVKELIRYRKTDPASKCYEVIITIRHSFAGWKGDILSVDRDYVITVWKVGKLYAWIVRNEYGVMLSGSNGANCDLYQGLGRTWRESLRTFKIIVGVTT